MYTINFRFRKKIYTLLNSSSHDTLVRVLFILLFVTFLFTSYLYGLIEVSSKKLIIRISSNTDESSHEYDNNKLSNIYDDSAENSEDSSRKFVINIKPLPSKKLRFKGLFRKIDRYHSMINTDLPHDDVEYVKGEKFKYDQNMFKADLKKRQAKISKVTTAVEDADDEDDDDDESEYEKTPNDGLNKSSKDWVSRNVFIKFLKYEKTQKKRKLADGGFKTVQQLLMEYSEKNRIDVNELASVWNIYFNNINEIQLNNDSNAVNSILKSMATSPVTTASEKEKGTQIKLVLLLEDGTDVLVKPMKTPRDYETPPDHFYFVDFERHHAEIAAYHVDKLLNFNRVAPTVGRRFDITSDFWQKADQSLAKTFFYSPANNTCFTGHCSYYCDTTHAICGKPNDQLEGSVQLFLPAKPLVMWQITTHPYRRTYNKRKKADWETNDNYCVEKLFQDGAFQSKLMLDILDMSVFDFFIGNMDRHHFERMISLGNTTFSLHLDNGRAFGRAFHDEMSILAPMKQCCLMRYSTYLRLKYLYDNNFALLLDASLRNDPLYPILTENYLKAVNRRLIVVFDELKTCLENFKPHEVLIDDGF